MREPLFHRSFIFCFLILVLFSVLCTQVPLLNYLGFEFSLAVVMVSGCVSGLFTLALWKQSQSRYPGDVWRFLGRAFPAYTALLLIPFIISLVNALFVKNCSISGGMTAYALLVIPGMFFSISAALCIGVMFDSWQKTLFCLSYGAVLLHIPVVTFFQPQIFAFNPILGFFPGFSYDEVLLVSRRLFIYRGGVLAGSLALCAAASWIWQVRLGKRNETRGSLRPFPLIEILLLCAALPPVLVLFFFSDQFGLSSSKEYIQQKLAGNYKTEHCELIYPAGSVPLEKIEQLGRLHEFYYSRISRVLHVQPAEPIVSFMYASAGEKEKLMGAGATNISKPWLRQMHMNLADIEPVLKHEMVHIFAAEFGWTPLKVSHNSGLVEGIAVAVGNDSYFDEPLHRSAALVFAAGGAPDLESLFSLSGFARSYAGTSYTLAGSFCKFLIDSFGIERFKQVYAAGDFTQSYGQALPNLLSRWRASINLQTLTAGDTVKARFCYRRPSLFGKECARVIAHINSVSKDLLVRKEYEHALASAEKSFALSRTSQAVFQKCTALFEMRKFKEYIQFCTVQLNDSMLEPSLLPLHLQLGDAYWAMDSVREARREYQIIAGVHLNRGYDEAGALRLESLNDKREGSTLRSYLLFSGEDTSRINGLRAFSSPPARYALAQEYMKKEKYTDARVLLCSIGTMENRTLEVFRLRRLGRVYASLHEWQNAMETFQQVMLLAPIPSMQSDASEWIERCKFEMK